MKNGGKCHNWKTLIRHFGWFSNNVSFLSLLTHSGWKSQICLISYHSHYKKCIWIFAPKLRLLWLIFNHYTLLNLFLKMLNHWLEDDVLVGASPWFMGWQLGIRAIYQSKSQLALLSVGIHLVMKSVLPTSFQTRTWSVQLTTLTRFSDTKIQR